MTLSEQLAAALMREHGDRWHRMTIFDIADAAVAILADMGRITSPSFSADSDQCSPS